MWKTTKLLHKFANRKSKFGSFLILEYEEFSKNFIFGAGTYHGRILILNRVCAKESTGHGSPLPMLIHGGPGRAGGGEEMGGLRGIKHYMQRVAVQGSPTMLTAITNVYQPGALARMPDGQGKIDAIHPFKKYFEELKIGDQLITEKRKINSKDIDKFADLSGDHFYVHIKTTDFTDTMFEQQVAHGYFILSAAAGLFVDSYEKNPVLLNYGIDELRFTKPVYPGTEIYIKLTCKEKISQELKPARTAEGIQSGGEVTPATAHVKGIDIPKGIVKWYVEILDETENPVIGVATILTMVRKKY